VLDSLPILVPSPLSERGATRVAGHLSDEVRWWEVFATSRPHSRLPANEMYYEPRLSPQEGFPSIGALRTTPNELFICEYHSIVVTQCQSYGDKI